MGLPAIFAALGGLFGAGGAAASGIGASVAGNLAGAAAGALLSRYDEQRARAAARGAVGVNFARLRSDAIKGGFNPLTALMATGGSGYQREAMPTLGSASFLTDAIRGITSDFFDMKMSEADRLAQSEMMRSLGAGSEMVSGPARHGPANISRTGGPGVNVGDVVTTTEDASDWLNNPPAMPEPIPGKVWVWDGAHWRSVLKSVADDLEVKPGDFVPPGTFQDEFNQVLDAGTAGEAGITDALRNVAKGNGTWWANPKEAEQMLWLFGAPLYPERVLDYQRDSGSRMHADRLSNQFNDLLNTDLWVRP